MIINKKPLKLVFVNENNEKPLKLNVIDEDKKKPLKLNFIDEDKKKPLKLNVIDQDKKKPLKLNVIDQDKKQLTLKDEKKKKPLKLKIVDENILKLNIINYTIQHPSDHMCYVLKSLNKRIYVGYTVDFNRRLRQHNGELVGGAKKTEKERPWEQICEIKGFYDKSSALRFEWRIQHSKKPRPNCVSNLLIILTNLINRGDGVLPWPSLTIKWI